MRRRFEENTWWVECNRSGAELAMSQRYTNIGGRLPNHTLILLLPDIFRDFTVHLART